MSNKKAKSKNKFKKSISAILASTMFLGSSAAITTLNGTLAAGNDAKDMVKAYFNDDDHHNQTRIMMNGDNTLNTNYWMNANIEADTLNPGKFAATLKFVIPGKNLSDLKFYVRDKSSSNNKFVEYKTAPNLDYLYLNNLNDNVGYEIHLYDGSLSSENFLTKAEFVVLSTLPTIDQTISLINAVNQPVTDSAGTALDLSYALPDTANNKTQFILKLPAVIAPFDATTIKVAFFADADSRSEKDLNIDHVLYDYCSADGTDLYFAVDAQWGTDAATKYEAHFYKDSVKPENFLCKAVEIPTS